MTGKGNSLLIRDGMYRNSHKLVGVNQTQIVRENGSCMSIVSHTEQDQVKLWKPVTGWKLCFQDVLVTPCFYFRINLTLYRENIRIMNGYVFEQMLIRHPIIAVTVSGGNATFIHPKKPYEVPGNRVGIFIRH